MALNLTDVVLRPFNYCIIDEVDSILIDEAQTPLIISNNIETPVDKYIIAAEITNYLTLNIHYKVDEKNKNVILTDQGSKQIEQILRIQDLYDVRDPWIPYVINAIKATVLPTANGKSLDVCTSFCTSLMTYIFLYSLKVLQLGMENCSSHALLH